VGMGLELARPVACSAVEGVGDNEFAARAACTYRVLHVERDHVRGGVAPVSSTKCEMSAQLDICMHPDGYMCVLRTKADAPEVTFELEGKAELRQFLLSYLDMRRAEGLDCIADNALVEDVLVGHGGGEEPFPVEDLPQDHSRMAEMGQNTPPILEDFAYYQACEAQPESKFCSDSVEMHPDVQVQGGVEEGTSLTTRARHLTSTPYEGSAEATEWGEGDPEEVDDDSMGSPRSGRGVSTYESGADTPVSPGCTSHRYDAKMKVVCRYFHLPINDASERLNICPTVLKKICRRNGVARWPFRKLKSIERLVGKIRESIEKSESNAGDAPSSITEQLRSELDFLERERKDILGLSSDQ